MRRTSANKMFKRKQILASLCVIFFVISATVIVALSIGKHTGNFVIRVQNPSNTKTVKLTVNDPVENDGIIEYSGLSNSLRAPAATNFSDYSPKLFLVDQKGRKAFEKIRDFTTTNSPDFPTGKKKKDGSYFEENVELKTVSLYCYTFYIVNDGDASAGIDINMTYSDDKAKDESSDDSTQPTPLEQVNKKDKGKDRYLSDIIRVMTYVRDGADQETANIYFKPADNPDYNDDENKYYPKNIDSLYINPFYEEGKIFTEKARIDKGNYIQYSLLIWLDGDDPDLQTDTEDYYNKTINFSIDIKVNNS